jgi:hypothetical protein
MKNGAVPSNSVAKLLKLEKIEMPKWVRIETKNKVSKKKEEIPKETSKAEGGEKPTEDVKSKEATVEEPKTEEKNEVETPKEGDEKENNPLIEEAKPEGEAKEGE